MKFSIVNLSPFHKFLAGMLCILIAVMLNAMGKFNFLQGVLQGSGLGLELLAIIGFYKIYKEKQSSEN